MTYTREFLEECLTESKKYLPKFLHAALVQVARARSGGKAKANRRREREREVKDKLQFNGVEKNTICFVGLSPTKDEIKKGQHFIGEIQKVFLDNYLTPLSLSFDEVSIGTLIPEYIDKKEENKKIEEWSEFVDMSLSELQPDIVVALGHIAKDALGDRADFVLPHPDLLLRKKNSGELERKIKKIKEKLDSIKEEKLYWKEQQSSDPKRGNQNSADTISIQTEIKKADTLKRIVYGVVIDSYDSNGARLDAHQDWMSPATIEQAAHDFLLNSRKINLQHEDPTKAVVVESWVEMYPDGEYKKAIEGRAHKAFERKFGTDVIHSGSWMLGVKLDEATWKLYEDGAITAFSPGGLGIKTPMDKGEMPKVEIIKIGIV